MTDLSGRVDTIEDQIISINQSLLQRPDLNTYSIYTRGHEQDIDTINALYASLNDKYKSLASLYIAIRNSLDSYNSTLTGHVYDADIHESSIKTAVNITGDYTALDTDDLIIADTDDSDIVLTLPLVSGKQYFIKKISAVNTLTITGSTTFDGTGALTLTGLYSSYTVINDYSYWYTF